MEQNIAEGQRRQAKRDAIVIGGVGGSLKAAEAPAAMADGRTFEQLQADVEADRAAEKARVKGKELT